MSAAAAISNVPLYYFAAEAACNAADFIKQVLVFRTMKMPPVNRKEKRTNAGDLVNTLSLTNARLISYSWLPTASSRSCLLHRGIFSFNQVCIKKSFIMYSFTTGSVQFKVTVRHKAQPFSFLQSYLLCLS